MKYSTGVTKHPSKENKVSGNFIQLAIDLAGEREDTEARDENLSLVL